MATLPVFAAAANTSVTPLRVVSLNYCLDDQLQPYADQGVITLYPSRDHGARFEPILQFAPDLVLATPFTAHYRLRAFEQAHLEVVVLEEPNSVGQAAEVAFALHELVTAHLGADDREGITSGGDDAFSANNHAGFDVELREPSDVGAPLVNDTFMADGALSSEKALSPSGAADLSGPNSKPTALFYLANQWSFGTDTLWHDVTEHLGWTNLAAQQGSGLVSVSLEHLLLWQPDIVVMEVAEQSSPDLAHVNLRHPSFQRYIAHEQVQVVQLPRALSGCMAQQLPDVLNRLREATL
ncbi:hypothetical protein FM042_04755 [Aliidiomarina halalkaliphila]|uniref:Fe/B12 periplasmic-binding domain-containing protein n=1 Tax=Aliidiomarina halalkaliphila TaxID=2593535 RepID=A0A552X576_9GAMM|nr:hypothetical protein [Aliidiomarina halalkaliphila]TRW50148.1 hypothetical protein FM042_04755 [Aliidiomarina halalkaliphila]